MTLRRREVEVDGIRSPLFDGGPLGHGSVEEAVVFVHGNPGSSGDWEDLAGRVSEFAPVLAPDMPGFGQADKPRDFPHTVAGYAAHLGRLLEHCGVRRAHLVLHDYGGPWGLAWAAEHPDALSSVTLIDTGVLLGYRWHWLARVWRTPGLGEVFMATATRPAFRLLLRQGNPKGLPRAFVDRMYDDFDRDTRHAVLRLYRSSGSLADGAHALNGALRPLKVPALVIWGRHDPYVPVEQAERQRETFPSAEMVILDGSGHWPFADDPEATAGALVPFLQRQFSAS